MRAARLPGVLLRGLEDRFVVPAVLKIHGVEMGVGCRFGGLPVIRMAKGARIQLGDNVLVNSRQYSNAATMPHRTVLSALSPDAAILIGADVGLSGVSIAAHTMVEIGERSIIGSGAALWDTDFHPLDPEMRRIHPTVGAKSAPIRIGCDVFIGARAMILKGVTIGNGALVGAGAVVTSDVLSGAVVAGNPARTIRNAESMRMIPG